MTPSFGCWSPFAVTRQRRTCRPRPASDPLRSSYFEALAAFAEESDERWTPGAGLVRTTEYRAFGLADAAVAAGAKTGSLVISTDGGLCGYLARERRPVLNFWSVAL